MHQNIFFTRNELEWLKEATKTYQYQESFEKLFVKYTELQQTDSSNLVWSHFWFHFPAFPDARSFAHSSAAGSYGG